VAFRQECSTTPDVLGVGSLSRDKGSPRPPQAPTNSRQIQHSADDLPRRLHRHAIGRGARLLAVAVAAGSHLVLVRLWVGDRDDEQRRKRAHNAPRACPLCTPRPARPQRPATVQGVLALAGGAQ
jgi:hypothetical protein